ncbi:MAG: TrmB family transcriptional regulator, partial [Halohasta sp.]
MTDTHTPPSAQYPVDPQSVSLPAELSSSATKLVYLYLQVSGESTVEELNRSLEIKTISLLPILQTLITKDLVARE